MARESLASKRERAALIEERMFDHYGPGEASLDYRTPFELTVAVVLSAQCTDAAVNKATPALFAAYPTPAALAQADPADVAELIRSLGFFRSKAMCEAFKDPQGIAVDTHVFRIAHRLKLAGPSADTPQKVEDILLKVYPHDQWGYINHQWVHFGREFCRARNPRCADCIVGDLCPTRGRW